MDAIQPAAGIDDVVDRLDQILAWASSLGERGSVARIIEILK